MPRKNEEEPKPLLCTSRKFSVDILSSEVEKQPDPYKRDKLLHLRECYINLLDTLIDITGENYLRSISINDTGKITCTGSPIELEVGGTRKDSEHPSLFDEQKQLAGVN